MMSESVTEILVEKILLSKDRDKEIFNNKRNNIIEFDQF